MTCSYCGSRNAEGEHRCGRCGRRPSDTLTGDSTLHRTEGPLALQPVRVPISEPPLRRPPLARPVQQTLFQSSGSNVIPFEQYAPVESRPRAVSAPRTSARPQRRSPRAVEGQGSLDLQPPEFLPPAPLKPRTLNTTVEAVIYCDSPVASKLHRFVAAALDWSLVLIAYGLFLLVFEAFGGQFTLDKINGLMFGGVLLLFAFTYGLVWALAATETAGMRFAQLRLLTFEGFQPDVRQRLMRLMGSSLSLFTVLGLAWSAVDEESLAWQDHISRTFPTPIEFDKQILRRR
jgi:uncharacterized RDD family membrane protein YckC